MTNDSKQTTADLGHLVRTLREDARRAIAGIKTGAGSEHFRHGRETMRDDALKVLADKEDASPPLTDGPVVAVIGFHHGRAYIAPAGTSWGELDAWRRVDSLAHAADRIGVEWAARA